ncbi:MAG: response regulator [Polaromonas sp.]
MNIAIFCTQENFLRLISTIILRLNQTGSRFDVVSVTSDSMAQIAVVDASDPVQITLAKQAVLAQPLLQIVNIVSTDGQAQGVNEVNKSKVVAGLMPMVKKLADALMASAPQPEIQVPIKRALKALAVDDSPTIRAQLQNIIGRMGMQCDTAESGAVALTKLEIQSYDIIYVDVVMPDIDGYQLTRLIKKERSRKGVPVIILTSQSSPFDRARGALAGCDTYLTKPVDARRFFEATLKVLTKTGLHNIAELALTDPSISPGSPRIATPGVMPQAASNAGNTLGHGFAR